MVLEAPTPKTAGARPPTYGGPPIGTTFSNDPDDRDEMFVHLRDNIQRLVRQATASSPDGAGMFLRLLDQRREWVKGEMDVEGMLTDIPKAPLGIPENIYDLAALSIEPVDDRQRQYQQMLDLIDSTMAALWDRMLTGDDLSDS